MDRRDLRIAAVYESTPLVCGRCGHCGCAVQSVAVIAQPREIRGILLQLIKTERAPPGFAPPSAQ